MAAAPRWKLYGSNGEYQAACKEIEAAAAVVTLYGEGSTIRDGHVKVVWTEGKDGSAGNSYDYVGDVVYSRTSLRG